MLERYFNFKLWSEKLLLELSPSEKVTALIEKAFNKIVKDEDSSCNSEEDAAAFDSNLSENEAMKKYSNTDIKIQKAAILMLNAFKQNIKELNYDKAVFISFEISKLIASKFKDSFPKTVRSKSHNLKENIKLCVQVYKMKISCEKFVEMSISDMKSDELKDKDNEALKDSIRSSQIAKATAETEMFECSKCKQKKCSYSQLQTRSCDEPMTTFVYCTVCGHRWKF